MGCTHAGHIFVWTHPVRYGELKKCIHVVNLHDVRKLYPIKINQKPFRFRLLTPALAALSFNDQIQCALRIIDPNNAALAH